MKWLSVVLGGAMIVLLLVLFQTKDQAAKQLEATRAELSDKNKQLESARADVAKVKAEMQKNFDELAGKVNVLTTEKTSAQEKIDALAEDMKAVLMDLQAEKASRKTIEARNVELTTSLESATDQLSLLKRQNEDLAGKYTSLEQTNAKTLEQFTAMRQDFVALTHEKEELESKWNDLAALKSQIGEVKLELRRQRIDEWKRSDRVEAAGGNQGFIMKRGEWTGAGEATTGGGKFPINEEIRRE